MHSIAPPLITMGVFFLRMVMRNLWLVVLLLVSCGPSASLSRSALVMELLQQRGLIYHYRNDQREQLRTEIEYILKN